ncbi:MAG: hypothetical protein R6V76_10210 [Desulfobacterales bacterium]
MKELEYDSLLMRELGKLPELQDGISIKEAAALDIIANIYKNNTQAFIIAFGQMYSTGIPNVRKYCTPLQAIFWLAEDNEPDTIIMIIQQYSLKALLDKAWKFYDVSDIEEDRLTSVIKGIKSDNMRQDYLNRGKRLSSGMLKSAIIEAYKKNRYSFTKEARATIGTLIDRRWDDFDEVTDRLNAPELVDYYERKLFRYVLQEPSASPYYVFTYNEGQCVSITGFTVYCLRKAGYSARELRLAGHNAPFHAVCLFEVNGEKYVMDNGKPQPSGMFPYKAITGQ